MKKTILTISVSFVAGAILTAVVSATFAYRWLDQIDYTAKKTDAIMLMQRAHDANLIRSGHLENYFATAERAFVSDLPRVAQYCPDEEWEKSAIWAIQEYYRDNRIEVPASIKSLIDSERVQKGKSWRVPGPRRPGMRGPASLHFFQKSAFLDTLSVPPRIEGSRFSRVSSLE